MFEYESVLTQIIEMVVEDLNSDEIRHVADELPISQPDSAIAFCKRYSLGRWLEEALIWNEIDVIGALNEFATTVAEEEAEELLENQLIEQSLQRAQGWAI